MRSSNLSEGRHAHSVALVGLFVMLALISLPSAIAPNDPGHDSLYVLLSGDSIVTGNINVSGDLNASDLRFARILYGDQLDVRANTSIFSVSSRPAIQTQSNRMYIDGNGDLYLNHQSGILIQVGDPTTSDRILNVSGSIYEQNVRVCLANGTNCPSELGGANITGSGVANTIPLWTDSETLSVSIITQQGTGSVRADGDINVTAGNDFCISGGGNCLSTSGGAGDVTGPGSSVDNEIVRFDSTTGKIIQSGAGITISDNGNLAGVGNITTVVNHFFIGNGATSTAADSIAIGETSSATGAQAIALGSDAQSTSSGSIAIGDNALANGNGGIAIGDEGPETIGSNDIALGTRSYTNDGVSIGPDTNSSNNGIAIGNAANAVGGGVSIGNTALSPSSTGTSVGTGSYSTGIQPTAVGYDSNASANRATAFGGSSFALGNGVAVGYFARAELGGATAVGYSTNASGSRSLALGNTARGAGGDAIAIGSNSNSTAESSIAIGEYSDAIGVSSIAIGADNADGAYASGVDSLAIGRDADATATNSMAIGENSRSAHTESIALGFNAQTTANNQLMIGNNTDTLNTYQHGSINVTAGNDFCISGGSQCLSTVSGSAGGWTDDGTNIRLTTTNDLVGIGTTTPETKLHITNNSRLPNTNKQLIILDHTIDNATTNGTDGISTSILFRAEGQSARTENIAQITANMTSTANHTEAGELVFYTRTTGGSLTEAMRINGAGNVGIGTTTPSHELQIISTAINSHIIEVVSSDAVPIFQVYEDSLTGGMIRVYDGSGNEDIRLSVDNNAGYINNPGNFGINTSTPKSTLEVEGHINATTINATTDICVTGGNCLSTSGGAGDVTGPGSSTDNAIARFDSTTGKIIQNSGITISDNDNLVGVGNITPKVDRFFIGTNGASATGTRSLAIGYNADSTADDAIAIGTNTNANVSSTLSFMANSDATATYAIAIGNAAQATGVDSVALGRSASASGQNSFSVGELASASAIYTLAIGYQSDANGTGAVALGQSSDAVTSAVAVGSGANAAISGAVSIGASSDATGLTSPIAVGNGAQAIGTSSVALGYIANASTTSSIAIGYNARSQGGGVVIGDNAIETSAAGTGVAIGSSANASEAGISIGTSANGENAGIAIGASATSTNNGVTIGPSATSTTQTAVTIGLSATTSSNGILALVNGASATGTNSMTIGRNAVSSGTDSITIGRVANSTGTESMALGFNSTADQDNSIALGADADTTAANQLMIGSTLQNLNTFQHGSINVTTGNDICVTGGNCLSTSGGAGDVTGPGSSTDNAIARFDSTTGKIIQNSGITIDDNNNLAGVGNISMTDDSFFIGNGAASGSINSMAIGTDADSSSGTRAIAIGYNATADANNALAIGYNAQTHGNGVALGLNTYSSGTSDIAIGVAARAQGGGSYAIGSNAYSGVNGIAIGTAASANASLGIALGYTSIYSGDNSIAIGPYANASGPDTIAIGRNSKSIQESFGAGYYSYVGASGVAIGYRANATADGAVVIGRDANTTGAQSVVIGRSSRSTASQSTVVGYLSVVSGTDSIAIGTLANASNTRSITIGREAKSTNEDSIAIGAKSNATGTNSIAIGGDGTAGLGAWATGTDSIAIGQDSEATTTNSIAIGENTASAGTSAVAIGVGANATSTATVAVGPNTIAVGNSGAAAFGSGARALDQQSIALGMNAIANDISNVALGYGSWTGATATNSVAIGSTSNTTASISVAVGPSAQAISGSRQVSMGYRANTTTTYAIAIGSDSDATATAAISIGHNSTASQSNSIALGPGTVTTAANQLMIGASQANINTYQHGSINVTTGNDFCISGGGNCLSTVTGSGGGWTDSGDQVALTTSTDNVSVGSSPMLFVDNTNNKVGINTTDPDYALEIVSGANHLKINSTSTSSDAKISLFSGSKQWQLSQKDSDNFLAIMEDGSSHRLVIEEGGNVGINTNDPDDLFHVSGGDIRLDVGQEIFFEGNGVGQIVTQGSNHRIIMNQTANMMDFYEYGSFRFRGDASNAQSGYALFIGGCEDCTTGTEVGINTTSPSGIFHVAAAGGDFVVLDGGNVGIGNVSPGGPLHISANANSSQIVKIENKHNGIAAASVLRLQNNFTTEYFDIAVTADGGTFDDQAILSIGPNLSGLNIFVNNTNVLWIDGSSKFLGIGTQTPSTELHVVGDFNVSGPGNIYYEGNLTGYGADIAEFMHGPSSLEPGDVVILSNNGVDISTVSYDTKVAGIVSTDPSHLLSADDGNIPVALTGRVPVKVTNEGGPIQIGDLLTTSSTPGHAMKCSDRIACSGSIVGKAMEASNGVQDKITALVVLG